MNIAVTRPLSDSSMPTVAKPWLMNELQAAWDTSILKTANKISGAQFNIARWQLTEAFPKYRYLANLICDAGPKERQELLEMAILLHARSAKYPRKHSHEKSFEHSLRVAENALVIAKALDLSPNHCAKITLKAMGHDLIEDFDTKYEELAYRFGPEVADSIQVMTTPKAPVLAVKYPEIVAKFLAESEMKKPAVQYMAEFKKNDRAAYNELKTRLKLAFKREEASQFSIDEVIIKGVDNADCFLSYFKDIQTGDLQIYYSNSLGQGASKTEGKVARLPSAKAARNLTDRLTYHVDAILARLDALSKGENGRTLSLGRSIKARQHLDSFFQLHYKNFATQYARATRFHVFHQAGQVLVVLITSMRRRQPAPIIKGLNATP